MRIAFLSTVYGYPLSGADSLWTGACEMALARGDSVFIGVAAQVAAHSRVQHMIQAGAHFFATATPGIPRDRIDQVHRKIDLVAGSSGSLISGLRKFRPDHVIFSCGGTYDLVREGRTLEYLRAQRVPYSVIANWQTETPHLSPVDMKRARAGFRDAAQLFFVSHRNLAITRRHLRMSLPQAALIQCPLRLPPDGGSPWPSLETPSFAAVARLEPVKGLDLLLPALTRSPGLGVPWRLNVYGEGPDSGDLKRQARQLGLAERVCFRGFVASLDEIWRENHCLISASRDEGLPTVMIEALLYGRPVIATQVGAAEEWIEEGKTGFICAPHSVEALALAIDTAWLARPRWREMGRIAHESAHRKHRPGDVLRLLQPGYAVL